MHYARNGIILYTRNYDACVRFYGETLELPRMFALEDDDGRLTCFDLGGAYLMVEPDDRPWPEGTAHEQLPMKLRFNVDDLDAAMAELSGRGVQIARVDYGWGAVADFLDPDGNPCQLRSEADFAG
ncbi:MAG: VOC family protein [Halofilum sp. (in: g-proteobacteria)]|nr:VOC family protein [Halofilum sp. (in: g-proteobacteria)]